MAIYYVNGSGGDYTWTLGPTINPGSGQTSPAGNDAEDGSLAHPWATIQKCETSGIAGSTIYVAEATYQEAYSAAYALSLAKGHTYQADGEVIVITNPGSPVTTALIRLTGGSTTFKGDFQFSGTDLILCYSSTSSTGFVLQPDSNGDKPTLTQVFSAAAKYMCQSGGGSGQTWNINAHLVADDHQIALFYGQSTAGANTWIIDTCDFAPTTNRGKGIFLAATNSLGSVTIKDCTITIDALAAGVGPINVNAGTWAVTVTGNTISIADTAAVIATGMIHVTDQANVTISDNTLNLNVTTREEVAVTYGIYVYGTTANSLGVPVVTNNVININSVLGIALLVGSNSVPTGSVNLGTAATVTGNQIRGPRYYDPAWVWASGDQHGILVGNLLNPTITGNIILGSYLSTVNKGSVNTVYTAAETSGNLIMDCICGPMVRGVTNAVVKQNMILFPTLSVSGCRGYDIQYNDSVGYNNCDSDNCQVLQNTVVVADGLTAYFGKVSKYDSSDPPDNLVVNLNKYYAENTTNRFVVAAAEEDVADWIARGYDANSTWANQYAPQYLRTRLEL